MSTPTALLPGLVTVLGDGRVLSLPGMSSDLQRGGQKQTPSEVDILLMCKLSSSSHSCQGQPSPTLCPSFSFTLPNLTPMLMLLSLSPTLCPSLTLHAPQAHLHAHPHLHP